MEKEEILDKSKKTLASIVWCYFTWPCSYRYDYFVYHKQYSSVVDYE